MEFRRNDFLEVFAAKQRELGQTQRLYKKFLDTKILKRENITRKANVEKAIERLTAEKNILRSQLWVADGVCHKKVDNQLLKQVHCLVECQDFLTEDIQKLKVGLKNTEREISRVNKELIQLNKQTVPENQHQAHVARTRKRMSLLHTQFEVSVGRECGLARENGILREKILTEINVRELFNSSYGKKVLRLTSDRKYLLELIEYAFGVFENAINAYEKMDNKRKKEAREREQSKRHAQTVMRVACTEQEGGQFVQCKCKKRDLADLQPKEYRRREKFRKEHVKKINLYKKIFDKIKAYTDSEDIASVIGKFKEQESIYYSYFTYANELGYHLTLLDNSVSRLFTQVKYLRQVNGNTLAEQLMTIDHLEKTWEKKHNRNEQLKKKSDKNDGVIEKLLDDIQNVFEMTRADFKPVAALLGDQTHVNLVNARAVLKVLEKRLNDLVACVYVTELKDDRIAYGDFCIQDIGKFIEEPTPVNDIVLTQQCPECGEADAQQDDAGALVVRTKEETRKRMYEKITQPEMQYRLHSLSQCRLPRSRVLTAKRNV